MKVDLWMVFDTNLRDIFCKGCWDRFSKEYAIAHWNSLANGVAQFLANIRLAVWRRMFRGRVGCMGFGPSAAGDNLNCGANWFDIHDDRF
jgi:hypothetical protein